MLTIFSLNGYSSAEHFSLQELGGPLTSRNETINTWSICSRSYYEEAGRAACRSQQNGSCQYQVSRSLTQIRTGISGLQNISRGQRSVVFEVEARRRTSSLEGALLHSWVGGSHTVLKGVNGSDTTSSKAGASGEKDTVVRPSLPDVTYLKRTSAETARQGELGWTRRVPIQ